MILQIKPLCESVREYFSRDRANHATDSGVDVMVPEEHVVPAKALGYRIPLGFAARPAVATHGYYLYPRSSIVKTPLRLANSVGIIDPGYTGELLAVVDNAGDADYVIPAGSRLFQVCMPQLTPIEVRLVDDLGCTERGAGGFGSTGTN